MVKERALKVILIISLIGILFSGFLSYQELFVGSCNFLFVSCGVNSKPIAGLPACVYGLVMYLVVFIVSLLGLHSKK
ncbi:MAG: hypothetical protein PHE48_02995 [Candidatus Daviesbacteria bacterium]|nr:hypothetical protein [Candidatus Daviesbacteria bacterium]